MPASRVASTTSGLSVPGSDPRALGLKRFAAHLIEPRLGYLAARGIEGVDLTAPEMIGDSP